MRGRLIYPFLIDIARLDTDATAEDPQGAGPAGLGYDDDFMEPVVVASSSPDDTRRGSVRRVEDTVQIRAQIEDDSWEALQALASGRSPSSLVRCVLHFKDIEAQGLLDPDGLPLLRVNDRLAAIRELDGTLIQNVPNPPGMHCTEAQPRSFWRGSKRNLFLMTFEARALSSR